MDEPHRIIAMTDDELRLYTLDGGAGSSAQVWGVAEMEMRNSLRTLEITKQQLELTREELALTKQSLAASQGSLAATQQMVTANEALSKSTKDLAVYTKSLKFATWGMVLITLATQITVIILSIKK